MALDPQLQQLLNNIPSPPTGRPDYPTIRAQADAMLPLIIGPEGSAHVASVEEIVDETQGAPVSMRIYRPDSEAAGTVHYIHGGGWSIGTLAMVDHTARRLCRDLSMVVVTSTYRLAPEHPFPAAFDDSLAAARWVSKNIGQLGGVDNPSIIAGDSAGGNLAAAVCLQMRDDPRGTRPFDLQLLLYPAVDLRFGNVHYASRLRNADPTLRSEMLEICAEDYAGSANVSDPRISPITASTLAGLPPAVVVVLQVDPLRDEAIAYAKRLETDGVPTMLVEFDNLTHGFVHMAGLIPAAAAATDQVISTVQSMLVSIGTLSTADAG